MALPILQKQIKMENSKEMSAWLEDFGLDHPLVIAGPCSAETEEQVLKIAHELKDTDVTVFAQVYGNQEPDPACLRVLVLLV